jgi:hypothetical protein
MHTYRPGNLRDEIPKRRRLWPTPGFNAMEEEEEEEYKIIFLCVKCVFVGVMTE